jgi:hypothetical protein
MPTNENPIFMARGWMGNGIYCSKYNNIFAALASAG